MHLITGMLTTYTLLNWGFEGHENEPIQTKLGIMPELGYPVTFAFYYTGFINVSQAGR